MKNSSFVLSLFAFSLAVVSVPDTLAQGPLTPPGPPGPTMRTLSQMEPRTPISSLPFTISTPGSYYLTTSLTGAVSSSGISVQASDVTIDLRGFSLVGIPGSLSGITVPAPQTGLIVLGGSVHSWGSSGINASNDSRSQFTGLVVSQNSGSGLLVGPNSLVHDCVASANTGDGLALTSSCLVQGNNCQANSGNGIHVIGNASRIEGNLCGANGSAGFRVDGSQNLIVKNSAANNTTNYNIAANNDYGPIYSSPGAAFTNSNPWANFGSLAAAPTCTDGIKNGNETDVDCGGGTCPPCAVGKNCVVGTDCVSGVCQGNVCQAATCTDGVKDGNETDVDCGGGTCPACATGKHCLVNTDCVSGACSGGVCVAATCSDGIKDGSETDVDCGGGTCPACAIGLKCLVDSDCVSLACDAVTLTCVANQCADHRQDGAETDVDCGGGTCATCATGKKCLVDTDCASNACDAISLTCVSSQCADHRQDGAETDVDCGGGTCAACATGKKCLVDTDCVSNACDANTLTCVSNQCADHRKDGAETDVDCGGGTCSPCSTGLKCLVDSDCVSNACDALSLTCVSSQCNDHRQDGNETDVDCGGANACNRCATGKHCLVNGDCVSGLCSGGACQ